MDINLSLAADLMMRGYTRLVTMLANVLEDAAKNGEASFSDSTLKPEAFVELLLASLNGLKKKAASTTEFRKQTKQVASIFLNSISV